MRLPRTATIVIAIVTAAAWLLTALMGADSRAAVILGVIPARLSGLIEITPAVPAWLTPLSSTLVHGGALHLALNMLMLVWCGTKVERILGLGRRGHALFGRRLHGGDRPVDRHRRCLRRR